MIHIGRVEIITDRAVSERQAQSASRSFARALGTALRDGKPQGARVHVDHLRLALPADALGDHKTLMDAARLVSRRILGRRSETP